MEGEGGGGALHTCLHEKCRQHAQEGECDRKRARQRLGSSLERPQRWQLPRQQPDRSGVGRGEARQRVEHRRCGEILGPWDVQERQYLLDS